jgi:hypothetical protein
MLRRAIPATAIALLAALGPGLGPTAGARADTINWMNFGTADSVAVDNAQGARGVTIRTRNVQQLRTISAEFTNNGTVIVNKNGSHFGFRATNTSALNVATTQLLNVTNGGKPVIGFNGLRVTDIDFTILDPLNRPTPGGTQQVGFFNPAGGGLGDLRDALVSANYIDPSHPLVVPMFTTDLGQSNPPMMYLGVDLTNWSSQGISPADSAAGSLYQVTNGLATSLLSGSGPSAASLAGFFFSSTPVSAGSTGFIGSPFTGEVEITSFNELSASSIVPEPSSLVLIATGLTTASICCCFRRRAAAT